MFLHSIFKQAQQASRTLNLLDATKINQILKDLAELAVQKTETIIRENAKDLAKMDKADPKYDRLKLTAERIGDIAADILNVSKLASPLGKIIEEKEVSNGLHFQKITVSLGVVGIIYEARPNVTFDVFALCLKAGNVSVLKGGSDAHFSNLAIIQIIHQVLHNHSVTTDIVQLLPPDREATTALLNAVGLVDVIIPRGSQQLINFVRQNAKVPVIETGAGIVHTYFDESGDLAKGAAIIHNAKTRRVSVCNALDCLIVHEQRLGDLPTIVGLLAGSQVEIFADQDAFLFLEQHYPADLLHIAKEEHFGIEFLAYKMSIKTVKNLEEALDHIATYSSKHSEAIIAENEITIATFLKNVDAAAVYANASTAFTDGGQFGLGAEIGISTQKLHARGPMGLAEITSYKWVIRGNGQTRN